MHFIVAGSTMFGKVLNSTCQRGDKCLPIPAIFHNTPLKGRCPRVHWYVWLLRVFIKCFLDPGRNRRPRLLFYFYPLKNDKKLGVKHKHVFAKNSRNSSSPTITRETFQLQDWDWATNVAASLPVLTLASVFPARLFDLRLRFASASTSAYIWSSSWNGSSVLARIAEDTMMDCLYLLPHQLAGGETMSIIWGVLSDGTGAVTFYANLWCARVNLWLWSRFGFISVGKLIERHS